MKFRHTLSSRELMWVDKKGPNLWEVVGSGDNSFEFMIWIEKKEMIITVSNPTEMTEPFVVEGSTNPVEAMREYVRQYYANMGIEVPEDLR